MTGQPGGSAVLVVGAGVVGLTTALRLREAGFDAHVHTRDRPGETTSAVAAALWYPYRAFPEELVTRWSARAYAVFTELAATPGVPVLLRPGRELWQEQVDDPWWRDAVPGFGRVPAAELAPGFADGYRFDAPVIDMSRYLPWLAERFEATGGTVTTRAYHRLDEATAAHRVVVNCTGLGARELVPDRALTPVRGQVVRLGQVGLTEWLLAEKEGPGRPTYIVPRIDDIVCGGTAQEGDERTAAEPATAEDILARCRDLVPELAEAPVLGHRVGLRPARPSVRLETERVGDAAVVHCYGHGGAGVTLSWGCADDVLAEVAELTRHT